MFSYFFLCPKVSKVGHGQMAPKYPTVHLDATTDPVTQKFSTVLDSPHFRHMVETPTHQGVIHDYNTHGKWCKSIKKNTPKLKFGTNVDIDVLNLNPRIPIEILIRFHKIQDGGQDGRQTYFDTHLHF